MHDSVCVHLQLRDLIFYGVKARSSAFVDDSCLTSRIMQLVRDANPVRYQVKENEIIISISRRTISWMKKNDVRGFDNESLIIMAH
jgi:hypothetical protein